MNRFSRTFGTIVGHLIAALLVILAIAFPFALLGGAAWGASRLTVALLPVEPHWSLNVLWYLLLLVLFRPVRWASTLTRK